MRYAFFGTPNIAETVLRTLCEHGLPPAVLITNPDRPIGRTHTITPPRTKQYLHAFDAAIPILQPEKLDALSLHTIRALQLDFGIVIAYAKILPETVLQAFPLGIIGVHPSLLPALRGASPIMSAILSGTPETGITLYRMDAKMDHGPILAQETLSHYVPEVETAETLLEKLAEQAGELLLRTLPVFTAGNIVPREQDEARATFTKKFTNEDAYIDAGALVLAESGTNPELALRLDRMIRALNPEPGAWTISADGKRTKLLRARLSGGRLIITRRQHEGRKPQDIA